MSIAWHLNWTLTFNLIINDDAVAGDYLAERLDAVLSDNWKSFASQKYFDHHRVFLSVVWSGPLLVFSTIILVSALFSSSFLIHLYLLQLTVNVKIAQFTILSYNTIWLMRSHLHVLNIAHSFYLFHFLFPGDSYTI